MFGVVALDQTVKLLVKLNMVYYESIHVFGSFFQIYFIENKGAAFGLTIARLLSPFVDISEGTGKLILTLFSLLLVGMIASYLYTIRHTKTGLSWWIALILGGALGNMVDRIFYGVWFATINDYEGGLFHGRVVDMFFFDLWRFTWPDWVPFVGSTPTSTPIFNFADAAITIGIVAILIWQRRFFGVKEVAAASAGTTTIETPHTITEKAEEETTFAPSE